ncbi:MAG: hypothetical protein EAZ07_10360 [Cytophagales bacterium]|nr:MAG: hypothetical protein EAZ07_10360 [Cytophagales bacterium]
MNWGYRIAILTGSFVVFMSIMVISAFNQNFDLVSEDYYGKELQFQKQIDKQKNHQSLKTPLYCSLETDSLTINFPEELINQNTIGTITFFRPSDAKKDFTIPIKLLLGKQKIAKNNFILGRYKMQVDYEVNGIKYYEEKSITIP